MLSVCKLMVTVLLECIIFGNSIIINLSETIPIMLGLFLVLLAIPVVLKIMLAQVPNEKVER